MLSGHARPPPIPRHAAPILSSLDYQNYDLNGYNSTMFSGQSQPLPPSSSSIIGSQRLEQNIAIGIPISFPPSDGILTNGFPLPRSDHLSYLDGQIPFNMPHLPSTAGGQIPFTGIASSTADLVANVSMGGNLMIGAPMGNPIVAALVPNPNSAPSSAPNHIGAHSSAPNPSSTTSSATIPIGATSSATNPNGAPTNPSTAPLVSSLPCASPMQGNGLQQPSPVPLNPNPYQSIFSTRTTSIVQNSDLDHGPQFGSPPMQITGLPAPVPPTSSFNAPDTVTSSGMSFSNILAYGSGSPPWMRRAPPPMSMLKKVIISLSLWIDNYMLRVFWTVKNFLLLAD